MDDVTVEVTELLDVMSIINATWPRTDTYRSTRNLNAQCNLFYESILLLIDNPVNRHAVATAWDSNPTYDGAAVAVARRAVVLGVPVTTVNFLIIAYLGG
jgi:hypothetical protein